VVEFKVCGITCVEDAEACISLGASAIGVNLIPESPRVVNVEVARAIARYVGDRSTVVLVVANLGTAEALDLLRFTGAGCLQLHGDEPPEAVLALLPRAYKAVRVATAEDVARAIAFPGEELLVDAKVSGKLGGTGQTADWELVKPLARMRRLTLAGGLTPENVGRAAWRSPEIHGGKTPTGFWPSAVSLKAFHRGNTSRVSVEQSTGYFGPYGGRFVAETLVPALDELARAVSDIVDSPTYKSALGALLADYAGRPTPLTSAERLARVLDPKKEAIEHLLLKREDLCHTGAHKINNALGQVLLAHEMKKQRIIAETGAGQHGVATATAAALFGIPCEVYMGAVDIERQAPNVGRMRLLGAKVIPVDSGSRTLKDAMNEALRDWVTNVRTTYYCLGSAAGPHPYPTLVAKLQEVIGNEARSQAIERLGKLPDAVVACVGGGSNAIGTFRAFLADPGVSLYGVEAAGLGLHTGKHAATLTSGRVGVLHGSKSYVLCDDDGQIQEAHSISAGLDYPGVGPEHSRLKDTGRATYLTATDEEALESVRVVARTEGIIIALEPAHAFARISEIARREASVRLRPVTVLVTLSGRGDKDLETILSHEQGHVAS